MKIGVKIKLDVTKIDKARLFVGQKGKYMDATVFIDVDQKDQYDNNGMVTQDVSKEEKEQGVKGAILGNVQVFWKEGGQAPQAQQPQQQAQQGNWAQQQNQAYQQAPQQQAPKVNPQEPVMDFDDDIPF